MRRTVLSTFLFAAILGLGCMGVAVLVKAYRYCEDTKHPQYDAPECEQSGSQTLNQELLHKLRSETDHVVCLDAITPNPKLSNLETGLYVWSTFAADHIVQTELYLGQVRRHEPYEEAIRDVLLTSPRRTFTFEDITGLPWIEIDFAADVDRVEAEFLPRINTAVAKRRAFKTIKGDMDKGATLNL